MEQHHIERERGITPPSSLKISDYSYELPDAMIARYPLAERDSSRLLHWDGHSIRDRQFTELPQLADPGRLMLFNNTRVIRARLLFRRESGAIIELFCLGPLLPDEFALNLTSCDPVQWRCLVGNQRRWKDGPLTLPFTYRGQEHLLTAVLLAREGDTSVISFSWSGNNISFGEVLERLGHMPIPPYLGRDDEPVDVGSYQTTYAVAEGSVAAPTAGLHFTPQLFNDLDNKGITRREITLHVGAGTFRPVKSELVSDHHMHSEHLFITRETLEKLAGGGITAVGTTTVRAVESLYWLGAGLAERRWSGEEAPPVLQWEPYHNGGGPATEEAIGSLAEWMDRTGRETMTATTGMIIVPGYRFRMTGSMITNFHQPRSTLLLLVAAFVGERWREIYSHAVASGYRFLSYGDSMFLSPGGGRSEMIQ